jgi:Lrp/AsnC family transcriptional regulator for asnA, asnC and gidA
MDPIRLAPVDIGIIRCLHEDARRSVASIAEELGLPESTVRHRLNRLVKQGVVEFTALTNPLQLGYQIWAIVEIQAELKQIRPVAKRLAAAPEVYFVGITTGGYDVLAGAVFRSNADLLDFITGRLSRIPGITRSSTSSVLEVVKRTMTFPLPADIARTPRRVRIPRKRARRASDTRE